MKKPVLSISIAAYNVENTLRECLDPFLETDALDYLDIMIVDDGSKDNTAVIAQEYADKYPNNIRLISKKNGGWGSTVNTGIINARGKYFRQLDGDDYYDPDNMMAYIDFLQQSNADMIISPYIEWNEENPQIQERKDCNPGCKEKINYDLKDVPVFTPFMHSIAIKTDLLQNRVLITENCFYTDTEFVLKSINQVRTIIFYDKNIYCYRRASVGQSMSLNGLEKHYADQIKVIEVLLDYMNQSVSRNEIKKIFEQMLLGTCWWQYLVMLYISPTSEHKRDLIRYDKMLKEKDDVIYNKINFGKLNIMRKINFFGYSVFARIQKNRDKRFTEDGRMLY